MAGESSEPRSRVRLKPFSQEKGEKPKLQGKKKKRPFLEFKKPTAEVNEETEIWKAEHLGKKDIGYFEVEPEIALKVVGGGIEYDPSEKRDTGEYLKEIAEQTPTLKEAVQKNLQEKLHRLFYMAFTEETAEGLWTAVGPDDEGKEEGEEAAVEIEFKALEITNKPGEGKEAKMGVSAKDAKTGLELKGELILFEVSDKEGFGPPKFDLGLEQEFELIEDVPLAHGAVWKTPKLKFEMGLSVSPRWERLIKEVVEPWVEEILASGLATEAALGLGLVAFAIFELYMLDQAATVSANNTPEEHRRRNQSMIELLINGYQYGVTQGSTTAPDRSSAAFSTGFEMGLKRRGDNPPAHLEFETSHALKQKLRSDPNVIHIARRLSFKAFVDIVGTSEYAAIYLSAFVACMEKERLGEVPKEDWEFYTQVTGKPEPH